jgi:hypothetical protein
MRSHMLHVQNLHGYCQYYRSAELTLDYIHHLLSINPSACKFDNLSKSQKFPLECSLFFTCKTFSGH